MLSGRRLDLLDPSPVDVEIEDIAHGLSRLARWNGQTEGEWPFSVAQHALLTEWLAGRLAPSITDAERLGVLLHDAPEYVIGDLISPFKAAVGMDYAALEARLMTAIRVRFGLRGEPSQKLSRLIKRADRLAAYIEATTLAGFDTVEAGRIFGRPRDLDRIADVGVPVPVPPQAAKRRFLDRFAALAPAAAPAGGGPEAETGQDDAALAPPAPAGTPWSSGTPW